MNLCTALPVFTVDDYPDRQTFQRDFVEGQVPALFRGVRPPEGADARWSPAALADRFGDRQVGVRESASPQFAIDPATGEPPAITPMAFGTFVAAMGQPDRHLYLMQQPVAKVFPELIAELPLPRYVQASELQSLNLWIGQAGNITRLHWDNYNNFLVQLWGRKRVVLLAPDTPGLRAPAARRTRAPHQVDLTSPVRVGPDTGDGLRCVLGPGEFLFIPAFWWHEIESIEPSVSVNAWWKATFEQCFVDSALSVLRETPADPDYLRFYLQTVRWEGSLWAAAEVARDKGVDWLCRRLLAAALDTDVKTACRAHGLPAFLLDDPLSILRQLDALEQRVPLPAGSAQDFATFFRANRDADADLAALCARGLTLTHRLG